jgi:hypothetical protein
MHLEFFLFHYYSISIAMISFHMTNIVMEFVKSQKLLACLVNVMARIPGVVVNFKNAGLGGRSHPKSSLYHHLHM